MQSSYPHRTCIKRPTFGKRMRCRLEARIAREYDVTDGPRHDMSTDSPFATLLPTLKADLLRIYEVTIHWCFPDMVCDCVVKDGTQLWLPSLLLTYSFCPFLRDNQRLWAKQDCRRSFCDWPEGARHKAQASPSIHCNAAMSFVLSPCKPRLQ